MKNIDDIEVQDLKKDPENKNEFEYNGANFYEDDLPLIDVKASDTRHLCDHKPAQSKFLEVQFKGNRRELFRNPKKVDLKIYDYVIVSSNNIFDIGRVIACGKCAATKASKEEEVEGIIERIATEKDIETLRSNRENEDFVIKKCRELIKQHNLDMKVNDAEWQLDHQRLTIFFTAPQRIDFRELVKDLARNFKTRIELRQISSREETKRLGHGVGPCGLSLCCTTFLDDFNHVTLDHARKQQLSNNVTKLSGYCGRLKCCLLYEYENYETAFQKFPPVHSLIDTEQGMAKIVKVNIFKEIAQVYIEGEGKYDYYDWEKLEKYIKAGKVYAPKEPYHEDDFDDEAKALEG